MMVINLFSTRHYTFSLFGSVCGVTYTYTLGNLAHEWNTGIHQPGRAATNARQHCRCLQGRDAVQSNRLFPMYRRNLEFLRNLSNYQTTRCHIPEYCNLHSHRRQKLKSRRQHCPPLFRETVFSNYSPQYIAYRPFCNHTTCNFSDFPTDNGTPTHDHLYLQAYGWHACIVVTRSKDYWGCPISYRAAAWRSRDARCKESEK
jgi:hypothetical protein